MSKNNNGLDFIIGALTGGTIAVLSTLLYTTKTGKKISNQIVGKFYELEDGVKDAFSCCKEKAEDFAEDAKDKAENMKDKAEDSADQIAKKLSNKAK